MPSSMRNSYPSNVAKNVVIEAIVQQDAQETPVEVKLVTQELEETFITEDVVENKVDELLFVSDLSVNETEELTVTVKEEELLQVEDVQAIAENSNTVESEITEQVNSVQEETIVLSSTSSLKKKKR
jgi:hypothetical protein